MLSMIDRTFDVAPLVKQIADAPQLWNEFDLRTNHPQSPHRELDDIFVRYNARENFRGDRHAFNQEHESVWWETSQRLPTAVSLALELRAFVGGTHLGMVLITRIPAGAQCYPHVDIGHHAGFYDKYAIQLTSAPGQSFHVEGEQLSAKPGQCYRFKNSLPHWVLNDSDQDRMTLICCIRNRFTGVS